MQNILAAHTLSTASPPMPKRMVRACLPTRQAFCFNRCRNTSTIKVDASHANVHMAFLMKVLFVFVLINFQTTFLFAQNPQDSLHNQNTAIQIPENLTHSTKDIAGFIQQRYSSEDAMVEALYAWITTHFSYDIPNMLLLSKESEANKIARILKTKKGVCEHYALLFTDICAKMNIQSHVVYGYTKQFNKLDSIAHAWCVCKVENKWQLFDPTWGAGYINEKQFIASVNWVYYKSNPVEFLRSHMPFEPFWQLVHYPIDHADFNADNMVIDSSKAYYSFDDSIRQYESMSDIERTVSSTEMLEMDGFKNHLIEDRISFQKKKLEIFQQNKLVEIINAAVKDYNSAVLDFNRFIQFRNRQFKPEKTDQAIQHLLDQPIEKLQSCKAKLQEIQQPGAAIQLSMHAIEKQLNQLLPRINEQQAFIDLYLSTNKSERKLLFIKKIQRKTSVKK